MFVNLPRLVTSTNSSMRSTKRMVRRLGSLLPWWAEGPELVVSTETLTNTADSTFVLGSCVVLSLLQIANRARLPSQMSLLGGKSMASNEGRSPRQDGHQVHSHKSLGGGAQIPARLV